ncbi:MAG: replication factor C small subunit [Candidatus Diapherotrites archaeon]
MIGIHFMDFSHELPWVEKYRPKSLAEVVGQREIINVLQSYVKARTMPNLLFSGPAGVGKTSSAIALAKEFFGDSFSQNFLELNSSDDRGIDVVRETIKNFARTLAFDSNFKIIFLDESDALTVDAQQALRRTMEKYARTARFILSCNYSSRIIEPIQSRCVVLRFRPLSSKEIHEKLRQIATAEKISVEEKAFDALIYVSQGDLRKAINIAQAASSLHGKVSEKEVYDVASRARPQEVIEMMELALSGKFLEARAVLEKLMYEHGMSGEDVIAQMHRELISMKSLSDSSKVELIDIIGEYSFRLVEGANERIQLEALLAQFMKFKSKK